MREKCPDNATDIIIEYNDGRKCGVVLIERKNAPFGYALPGGFAIAGLSYEQNAKKEAKEETNLDIVIKDPEHPFCVKSQPTRDPRGHVTSITYVAKGYGLLYAGDDANKADIFSLEEIIELIHKNKLVFDHADILKEYLATMGYAL
jgi:8-oxo-dGTP diphosphatase